MVVGLSAASLANIPIPLVLFLKMCYNGTMATQKRKKTSKNTKRRTTRSVKEVKPEHELPGGFWRQTSAVLMIALSLFFVITWFGHGGTVLNEVSVRYGESPEKVAEPSKKGHTFVGWKNASTEVTSTDAYLKNTVRGDMVYVAQYSRNKYKVKLYDTDGAAGAAKGAGIGCGIYKDHDEAFSSLEKLAVIEPDPKNADRYEEVYQRWKRVLDNLS